MKSERKRERNKERNKKGRRSLRWRGNNEKD